MGKNLILAFHLVCLVLASSAFTLLTFPLDGRWRWSFFSYSYQNGWGYTYHSSYSIGEVLIYLVAYASGVVVYVSWPRRGFLTVMAMLACLVGAGSFLMELLHWGIDFNLSLIVSLPALVLAIGIWTAASTIFRRQRRPVAQAVGLGLK
jgi:hypothetical protein